MKSFVIKHSSAFVILPLTLLACVAGVRRGGKGERRARQAREDRTPRRAHFDFPPYLSTACHAGYHTPQVTIVFFQQILFLNVPFST